MGGFSIRFDHCVRASHCQRWWEIVHICPVARREIQYLWGPECPDKRQPDPHHDNAAGTIIGAAVLTVVFAGRSFTWATSFPLPATQ